MAGVGGGQTQGGGQSKMPKIAKVAKVSGLQGAHTKVMKSVSKAGIAGNTKGSSARMVGAGGGTGKGDPGPTGGGRGKMTGMTAAMKGNARRGK